MGDFISTEIINHFDIPQIFVSKNAQYYTAVLMKEFMAQQEIKYKTLLTYGPMSNVWPMDWSRLSKQTWEKCERPRGRLGWKYTECNIWVSSEALVRSIFSVQIHVQSPTRYREGLQETGEGILLSEQRLSRLS